MGYPRKDIFYKERGFHHQQKFKCGLAWRLENGLDSISGFQYSPVTLRINFLSKYYYIFYSRKIVYFQEGLPDDILKSSSQIHIYGTPLKRYLHPFKREFPIESKNVNSVPYCLYLDFMLSSVGIRVFKWIRFRSIEKWTLNGLYCS